METHELSEQDRDFRSAFEACTVAPSQFNHDAHVRLAYVYLVESDVESAVQKMREALLTSSNAMVLRAPNSTKQSPVRLNLKLPARTIQ